MKCKNSLVFTLSDLTVIIFRKSGRLMTISCLFTLSISSLRYLYIEANTFYYIAYLIMQHLLQGVILNMFFDFILT